MEIGGKGAGRIVMEVSLSPQNNLTAPSVASSARFFSSFHRTADVNSYSIFTAEG